MKPIRTSFMVILVLAAGYAKAQARIPLKEAKLNIEHNATDRDTGFQGFIETVEPENKDTSVRKMLGKLPEGRYRVAGAAQENGERLGRTSGRAWLTHDIPRGPRLVSPAEGATVPADDVVADWAPVSRTITGKPVRIIAYQLIIEKDAPPPRHMIGTFGLSMYVPPSTTRIEVPKGALQPRTSYDWEVLAIERSGNQTLSSGSFKTG